MTWEEQSKLYTERVLEEDDPEPEFKIDGDGLDVARGAGNGFVFSVVAWALIITLGYLIWRLW
jgi:hypothetical protein